MAPATLPAAAATAIRNTLKSGQTLKTINEYHSGSSDHWPQCPRGKKVAAGDSQMRQRCPNSVVTNLTMKIPSIDVDWVLRWNSCAPVAVV